MSEITTHVLDTVLGKPAAGIPVRLERLAGGWVEVSANGEGTERGERVENAPGDWVEIAAGVTDADGRCRDLEKNAEPGDYRLIFDVSGYFRRLGRSSIYPEIPITFTCGRDAHYHLPLLVSDNGYTTYRGN